jgi:hypothetical protein
MADRKDRFALISRFEKHCKMNNVNMPTINKYNEQWAADALLESFDMDDLYKSMEYYFSINHRPTWKGFANNADRLLQSMQAKKEDQEFRAEMRQKAREWLSESRG